MKTNAGQEKVLNSSGNLLVSASAGSGKTTVMIEKIMRLILSGTDIRRILVMTFSRASANEMKERLVAKIYDYIRNGEGDKTILSKQLEWLPFSNICTIDSFCKNMFNKYFALINRDPSANVIEPSQGEEILRDIIEKLCVEYIEKNDKTFLLVAGHLSSSRRLEHFKNTVVSMRKFFLTQPDLPTFIQKAQDGLIVGEESPLTKYFYNYFSTQIKKYGRPMREASRLLTEYGEGAKYIDACNEYADLSEKIADMKDLINIVENIKFPNKFIVSKKTNEGRELYNIYKEKVTALLNEIKPYLSAYYDFDASRKNYEECKFLINFVLEGGERFDSYKKQRNLLDFSDLSTFMLKILKDDGAREEIKNSFDYIFVDEYQDTNYMQESILRSISKDNNVFVVGDVKQAIYHFRYAEPRIFTERMNAYNTTQKGQNILLNENYRSDGGILDFTNKVCSEIMTEELGGIDYKKEAQLVNGAEYLRVNDLPTVQIGTYADIDNEEILPEVYSVKDAKRIEKADIESRYIAQTIKQTVGKKDIFIAKTKSQRPIEYSDVAVLVRNRAHAQALTESFNEYGIPYYSGDMGVSKSAETDALADFLRVVQNMRSDKPLAVVMLSPIGDFSEQELLKIHNASPKLQFSEAVLNYSAQDDIYSKIRSFIEKIEKYRTLSAYCRVGELLSKIIAEGYGLYLMTKGANFVYGINTFIQKISGSDNDSNITDFLDYYDNRYEGAGGYPGDNAVTVTTLHKSKGLEYPIVFMPYLHREAVGINLGKEDILLDTDLGVAIKGFDDDTLSKQTNFATMVIKLKKLNEEVEEMARLYYVGMTRAKNHLFLSGKENYDKNGEVKTKEYHKAKCFMDWLIGVREYGERDIGGYFVTLNCDNLDISAPPRTEVEQAEVDLSELEFVYPYIKESKTPSKYSVTRLLNHDKSPLDDQDHGVAELTREKVSADVGVYYHTVMQYIDYEADSLDSVKNCVTSLISQQLLPPECKDMDMNIILRVLKSELIGYAKQAKYYREQPFMLYTDRLGTKDKVLVQGVIDLLIIGEKTVLVDFKTSYGSPNELKERYSQQLLLYKEAVESIRGIKVDECVIYNILRNYTVSV